MAETNVCPKCGGKMEEGHTDEHSEHGYRQGTWIEGKMRLGFRGRVFGSQTKDRRAYKIDIYRCQKCGYLESYAKDES